MRVQITIQVRTQSVCIMLSLCITEKYLQHAPTGSLGLHLYNVFQPHEYIEHTGRHKIEETPLRPKVRRLFLHIHTTYSVSLNFTMVDCWNSLWRTTNH